MIIDHDMSHVDVKIDCRKGIWHRLVNIMIIMIIHENHDKFMIIIMILTCRCQMIMISSWWSLWSIKGRWFDIIMIAHDRHHDYHQFMMIFIIIMMIFDHFMVIDRYHHCRCQIPLRQSIMWHVTDIDMMFSSFWWK